MKRARCPYCDAPLSHTRHKGYTTIWCSCSWSAQVTGPITSAVLTRQAKSCQADRGPESKPLYLEG